jgi:hypothetical protein
MSVFPQGKLSLFKKKVRAVNHHQRRILAIIRSIIQNSFT